MENLYFILFCFMIGLTVVNLLSNSDIDEDVINLKKEVKRLKRKVKILESKYSELFNFFKF